MSHFMYLFGMCLKVCVLEMFTLEHTLKLTYIRTILFGIIKYCHILHMYSIQDKLISSLETKQIMLAVVLRHFAPCSLSFLMYMSVFVNWKFNLDSEENETVSRVHVNTLQMGYILCGVLSFSVGCCFSHCALPPTEHTYKNIGWWYGKVLGLILVWLVLFYIISFFVIAAWDF